MLSKLSDEELVDGLIAAAEGLAVYRKEYDARHTASDPGHAFAFEISRVNRKEILYPLQYSKVKKALMDKIGALGLDETEKKILGLK